MSTSTAAIMAEKLAHVGEQHLRSYSPAVRLLHAGFREGQTVEGVTIYECHAGAFSVQVRQRDGETDGMTLHIAYRAAEGGRPMRYRPWSIALRTDHEVVAEALLFLKTVDQWSFNGGD